MFEQPPMLFPYLISSSCPVLFPLQYPVREKRKQQKEERPAFIFSPPPGLKSTPLFYIKGPLEKHFSFRVYQGPLLKEEPVKTFA